MESQVELAVDMTNALCAEKVEKALKNIEGVKSFEINPSRQSVLVKSNVMSETLKNAIEKETGIHAVIMGQGSAENLGSAVAAIAYGPSKVRGLLRMTQMNKETCIIEGTVDGFSDAKNICVSLHESGDLSHGCESCGSLYESNNARTDVSNLGIINSQSPSNDGSIEFRLSNSNLKVSEMIGRSIVVHEGLEKDVQENRSKRLACGIIARSSGLFQNSKRFCACDGVTLWEEKKRLQESDKLLFSHSN